MCAPLTPPATYTAKATAKPQPQPMMSQSPLAAKIWPPRPDWLSAATAIATTPSPKQMSTNVPTNSAASSPARPTRQPTRRGSVWTAVATGGLLSVGSNRAPTSPHCDVAAAERPGSDSGGRARARPARSGLALGRRAALAALAARAGPRLRVVDGVQGAPPAALTPPD